MLLTKKFVESVIERNIADDRMTTFSGTIKCHFRFTQVRMISFSTTEIFDSEPFAVATLPLEEFVDHLNEVLETLTEAR